MQNIQIPIIVLTFDIEINMKTLTTENYTTFYRYNYYLEKN